MMEIFVIRHTKVNIENKICYGSMEVPLREGYIEKAKIFQNNLPSQIDKIFSSPSQRCTDLLDSLNLKYTKEKSLTELHFGDWEGKHWDEIEKSDLDFWMQDYVHRSPKNGEKMIELNLRVMNFITKISKYNFKKILVVTHSGVIRCLLSNALNISLNNIFDIDVKYDEIYRFSIMDSNQINLRFEDKKNTLTQNILKKIN